MDSRQAVETFTQFFTRRGHAAVAGTTLLPPPGDPLLFTSAGMQPLTPYLTGRPHPQGSRLTGVQRCLRTTDLDQAGDATHLTVFQMLGSWSLGDYDGPQSQRWGLELLCDHFGLDPSRLHATAFGGSDLAGPDTAAAATWAGLGVPCELLGEDGNWWSNGPAGPCGPDTEIFAWTGDGPPQRTPGTDERWVEVWNHVTMTSHRDAGGSLTPLPRPSVDTGMGLERLLMVAGQSGSVYETDALAPWRAALAALWPQSAADGDSRARRLVTDHLRAAVVVIADGVMPAGGGRGYVLRRLLRRALTQLWGADPASTLTLAKLPDGLLRATAGQFGQQADPGEIRAVLAAEEDRFRRLLRRGEALLRRLYPAGELTQADYTFLHDTHGLPAELVTDVVTRLGGRAGG